MILSREYFSGMQYSQAMVRCLPSRIVRDIRVQTDFGDVEIVDFFVVDTNNMENASNSGVPYVAAVKIKIQDRDNFLIASVDLLIEMVEQLPLDSAQKFMEELQAQKLKHIKFVGSQELIGIYDNELSPGEVVDLIAKSENLEAIHELRDLRDTINRLKWNNLIFNKNNNDKEGENTV